MPMKYPNKDYIEHLRRKYLRYAAATQLHGR